MNFIWYRQNIIYRKNANNSKFTIPRIPVTQLKNQTELVNATAPGQGFKTFLVENYCIIKHFHTSLEWNIIKVDL